MDLDAFLKDQNVAYEKHFHEKSYTAQELAHAEHVSGYMVAKPVIVKTEYDYAMCVVPAPHHLNLSRVADALQESEVHLASERELANLFPDCELGAEPAIGSIFGMDTVIDASMTQDSHVVMQAGTHHEAVKMSRDDWQRVCEPIVAPISQPLQ